MRHIGCTESMVEDLLENIFNNSNMDQIIIYCGNKQRQRDIHNRVTGDLSLYAMSKRYKDVKFVISENKITIGKCVITFVTSDIYLLGRHHIDKLYLDVFKVETVNFNILKSILKEDISNQYLFGE